MTNRTIKEVTFYINAESFSAKLSAHNYVFNITTVNFFGKPLKRHNENNNEFLEDTKKT